jgi:hypothetical protein
MVTLRDELRPPAAIYFTAQEIPHLRRQRRSR